GRGRPCGRGGDGQRGLRHEHGAVVAQLGLAGRTDDEAEPRLCPEASAAGTSRHRRATPDGGVGRVQKEPPREQPQPLKAGRREVQPPVAPRDAGHGRGAWPCGAAPGKGTRDAPAQRQRPRCGVPVAAALRVGRGAPVAAAVPAGRPACRRLVLHLGRRRRRAPDRFASPLQPLGVVRGAQRPHAERAGEEEKPGHRLQ
ncbi:unnamed protein product, partial [Ixodes pacificus]